jgi:hypothetical protein
VRDAYVQYAAAKRAWLSGLRDLAIEMAPHLESPARLRFSLQLAYLDRDDVRFEYLLENAPERLKTAGSLAEFVGSVDTGWSDEDEALLGRLRPEYQELCAMIASVKAKAEEPATEFSDHLTLVSKTERSIELLTAFRREIERLERDVWSA